MNYYDRPIRLEAKTSGYLTLAPHRHDGNKFFQINIEYERRGKRRLRRGQRYVDEGKRRRDEIIRPVVKTCVSPRCSFLEMLILADTRVYHSPGGGG